MLGITLGRVIGGSTVATSVLAIVTYIRVSTVLTIKKI